MQKRQTIGEHLSIANENRYGSGLQYLNKSTTRRIVPAHE